MILEFFCHRFYIIKRRKVIELFTEEPLDRPALFYDVFLCTYDNKTL
jgi:hypothetical protein